MAFVVAYDVPHNEGREQGIIDGPGQSTETTLVDLYEVDAEIRSFGTRREAQEWLDKKADGEVDDDDD